MILFFVNNRASEKYFSILKEHLLSEKESAEVFRDSLFRWPDLHALREMPLNLIKEKINIEVAKARRLKTIYFWLLFVKSCWLYLCDVRTIKQKSPSSVVVWNGLMLRRALFVMAAQRFDIKTIFIENGLLPETTVVDGQGINFKNSVPRSVSFYKEYQEKIPTELPKKLVPRAAKTQKTVSGRPLPDRYVFVPFQVDTDSQILLFSPWITSMEHLFNVIMSIGRTDANVKFVFKEHPSSPVDYRYLHSEIDPEVGFFANEYSTQELIEKSDAVITINSTVGIESLLLNKKVICLGDAFYNIEGITLKAESASELKHIISSIDNIDLDREIVCNFLRYLKGEYLVKGSWRSPSPEHLDHMMSRILQIKRSTDVS
ncbi:hypothetical protein Q4508_01285 [Amphritea sp. 2_MG-2023]|uniref:capsular polysaccharide export protein, LipB/KpsS family n=1 Tax=Amphritea TaxID=515417 RepID=UPI001C067812|nr:MULTISPECIES: hypothetical protein [Amphritea]MBU2965627.1 hypothetical protein [Amphritea atlantica]MDO6417183.1 hypothetical protein [Amphritea sp. 2_MG-2023]